MIVAVHSDSTPDNNGIYRLTDTDYTVPSNWESTGGVSYWDRSGTTIEPLTANDNLDIGTGVFSGVVADGTTLETSGAPTTDTMLVNKKYVDDEISGSSSVYIPYTGATQNANLNDKSLVNISELGVGVTSSLKGVLHNKYTGDATKNLQYNEMDTESVLSSPKTYYGLYNDLTKKGDDTQNGLFTGVTMYGMSNEIDLWGTFSNSYIVANTQTLTGSETRVYDRTVWDSPGKTNRVELRGNRVRLYAVSASVLNGDVNRTMIGEEVEVRLINGNSDAVNMYGFKVSEIGTTLTDTVTGGLYGMYVDEIKDLAGAPDGSWAFYNNSDSGNYLGKDNTKNYRGSAKDVYDTYTGTAWQFNAPADIAQLSSQPTGTVDLAIATTKYVDDNAGSTLSLSAELEAQINQSYVSENFNYTAGVLTSIDYKDAVPTTIYTKVFTYTGGVLTQWVITRVVDSATLTCSLTYSNGTLITKTYS